MKSTENFSRTCRSCLVLLQQLLFVNSSLNSSNSEPESITEEQNTTSVWTEFDTDIAQNYRSNFKIGHVNENSID